MAKSMSFLVELPQELQPELERIAFERSQAGNQTTLKQVIVEALERYLEDDLDAREASAALARIAAGGKRIALEQALAELGEEAPVSR